MPFEVYLPDDEPNTYPIPPRFRQDDFHAHDDCMPNTHVDVIIRENSQPRIVGQRRVSLSVKLAAGLLVAVDMALRGLARWFGNRVKYR